MDTAFRLGKPLTGVHAMENLQYLCEPDPWTKKQKNKTHEKVFRSKIITIIIKHFASFPSMHKAKPSQAPYRLLALCMLNLLPMAPGKAKPNPAFVILSLWWVGQRVWEWKGTVSIPETLPCRSILGDFPSSPISRTFLPYSTAWVAVSSLLIQRLRPKTFPTGLPGSAGALQGRKSLTAERRRWKHPLPDLWNGLPLPTVRQWLAW